MAFVRNLFQTLWRLLPDRCQVDGCRRNGVRGNENVIDGKRVCDDCHARMMTRMPDLEELIRTAQNERRRRSEQRRSE